MRTPTAAQLLRAWEIGCPASTAVRALELLGVSYDGLDAMRLLAMPLGRRDALLLQLHRHLFGGRLDSVAQCPACGATVEASFDADALQLKNVADDETQETAPMLEWHSAANDLRVRFRSVNSEDLLAIQSCSDGVSARQQLLQRCVIEPKSSLPPAVQDELVQAMAAADPQADLQLDLTCPDCAHRWQPAFDIAQFLWQELHAWAIRLLREVDAIARVYHWSEADILAMSPRRRQAYLEQCVS